MKLRTLGLCFLLLLGGILSSSSRAQAVAFVPNVAAFPNGVTMSATPVVSADRRYVRLGLNPQFTALEGFNTIEVPAAVSGGGLRNVDAALMPDVAFGMDGPVGGYGYNYGSSGPGFDPGGMGMIVPRPRRSLLERAPAPASKAKGRSKKARARR